MPALIIPKTAVIVSSIVLIPATQRLPAKANRLAQSKGFWPRVRLRDALMISGNTAVDWFGTGRTRCPAAPVIIF
jgi:hypothetical protein